eukprot:4870584-Amphidinium_carterae.1
MARQTLVGQNEAVDPNLAQELCNFGEVQLHTLGPRRQKHALPGLTCARKLEESNVLRPKHSLQLLPGLHQAEKNQPKPEKATDSAFL